jgi:DNA repair protein RadC
LDAAQPPRLTLWRGGAERRVATNVAIGPSISLTNADAQTGGPNASRRGMQTTLEAEILGARERLMRVGVRNLSDDELVALILGTGRTNEPVAMMAARLVRDAPGIRGLRTLGVGALARTEGVGVGKAARLVAAFELGRRASDAPWSPRIPVESSRDVERLVGSRLRLEDVEHFVALALDAKNRLLAELTIAKGGIFSCPVAPGDVFRALLREGAVSVIFVHNHPSGDAEPSPADRELTARLVEAGDLLGVRVHDHVIVGKPAYTSFADRGWLYVRGESP